MGTSASENIAIRIETTADLTGTRAARGEMSALSQEAAKTSEATSALFVSADQAAFAFKKYGIDLTTLGVAVGEVATATEKAALTTEAATVATDRESAAVERRIRQAGLLEVAAYQEEARRQASLVTSDAIVAETERQAAAEERLARSMGLAEVAAYKENAAREQSLVTQDKLPASTRRGAGALSQLAFAAQGTNGSMRSVITSAGLLTTTLAQTAEKGKFAASAGGLGALAVLFVTLVDLVQKARHEMDEMAVPTGALSEQARAHVAAIKTEKEATIELALAQAQAAAAQQKFEELNNASRIGLYANQDARVTALQNEADAIAKVSALELRRGELAKKQEEEAAARALGGLRVAAADSGADPVTRYKREEALIEAEKEEAIRKGTLSEAAAEQQANERRRQSLRAMDDFERGLDDELARARDEGTKNSFDQRRELANREWASELATLEGQVLPTEEKRTQLAELLRQKHRGIVDALDREQALANDAAKAALQAGGDDPREAFQGRLAQISMERDAQIKAGIDVAIATAAAEQKKRALYAETSAIASRSFVSLAAESLKTISTQIQAHASLAKIITAAALTPIVKELEALGTSEATKAVAHFADFDLVGGSLHSAASIAAFAAAAKVSSQGGLGSSGGGGGSAPSGSGGGSTISYANRDAAPGGPVVVNLLTTDPYNRENIMIASYHLQRSGIMKRPIVVPPTTGLQVAEA